MVSSVSLVERGASFSTVSVKKFASRPKSLAVAYLPQTRRARAQRIEPTAKLPFSQAEKASRTATMATKQSLTRIRVPSGVGLFQRFMVPSLLEDQRRLTNESPPPTDGQSGQPLLLCLWV